MKLFRFIKGNMATWTENPPVCDKEQEEAFRSWQKQLGNGPLKVMSVHARTCNEQLLILKNREGKQIQIRNIWLEPYKYVN